MENSKFVEYDFTIEAQDNTLRGDHIYEGDLVYIKKNTIIQSGDIIALKIGDSDIKIGYCEFHPEKTIVILKKTNPNEDEILDLRDVFILGKAVAFMSRLEKE